MFGPRSYLIPFVLFLLLLVLSAYTTPVWYDDAGHFLVIDTALQTGQMGYPAYWGVDMDSPFITLGRPLNETYRLWLGLWGGGMAAARGLSILFSLAAAWAFWRYGRDLKGATKATWALWIMVGNVQWVTYGAQLLGEGPMLLGVFGGMAALAQWKKDGQVGWAALGGLAWWWAVNCKAYIALPLGLAVGGMAVWSFGKKDLREMGRWLLFGAIWTLAVVAGWIQEQGGWAEFVHYLEDRQSYGNEFFVFAPTEALRFLLFKPLFALGILAMVLRLRVHPRPADRLPILLQLFLTLFFLCSQGFDRFGFLLLFLPALYLAEFTAAAWARTHAKPWLRAAFLLLFALLFTQQTPIRIAQRLLHPNETNAHERAVAEWLGREKIGPISTVDHQLYPFLSQELLLPATVPSNKMDCQPPPIVPNGYYIAGPYAFTEYQDCIDWTVLTPRDTFGDPYVDGYVIFETPKVRL